jgi:hypothetical protein
VEAAATRLILGEAKHVDGAAQQLLGFFNQREGAARGELLILSDETGDSGPHRGELAWIVRAGQAAESEQPGRQDVLQSRFS